MAAFVIDEGRQPTQRLNSPRCAALLRSVPWSAILDLGSQRNLHFAATACGKALTLIERQSSVELRKRRGRNL